MTNLAQSISELCDTVAKARDENAALRARIAELEAGIKAAIERSHNDPLGTSKVIDMRRILEGAIKGE